jgi:uncharacterized protein
LMVFSAIALYGDPLLGLINGFLFAALTSPSLIFAMHAAGWIKPKGTWARYLLPLAALPPAAMAFLRGFAEMGAIEHLSIVLPFQIHLVLF